MVHLIDKSVLVAEIEKAIKIIYAGREYVGIPYGEECIVSGLQKAEDIVNTLEVIDPYKQIVQYENVESGIKAHAEDYSFNIESELFNQLTKEQQALWRKEIEQACISGGYAGVELARDPRYKENLEVKEMDLDKEIKKWWKEHLHLNPDNKLWMDAHQSIVLAKHFFELGIKAQKGEEV